MRQIKPKLKEGTKIDEAKIFVCTLYVCVTIRSSECPIMWFRIAENGSVNGDAAASPFTAVSPLCHRGEFQHGESPFTAVTPPKRKTSPVITGHLITGYHAVMVTSFSALISIYEDIHGELIQFSRHPFNDRITENPLLTTD